MAWRMASVLALVVALAVAAATCAEASGYDGAGKSKSFTVTGTVLCQDCTKNWNAYAYNAKPIAGSTVAVTCLCDKTWRTAFHSTDKTDEKGVFNIEVPNSENGISLKASECLVRLVSSGDGACDVLTNFHGGKTGERPSRPSKRYLDDVVYSAGPYYCTPRQCEVSEYTC